MTSSKMKRRGDGVCHLGVNMNVRMKMVGLFENLKFQLILITPGDIRRESKISQEEDEDGRSSATSIVEDDILAAIEEAYPNSLTIDDMSRYPWTQKVY